MLTEQDDTPPAPGPRVPWADGSAVCVLRHTLVDVMSLNRLEVACHTGQVEDARTLLASTDTNPKAHDSLCLALAAGNGNTAITDALLVDGRACPLECQALEWACRASDSACIARLVRHLRSKDEHKVIAHGLVSLCTADANASIFEPLLQQALLNPKDVELCALHAAGAHCQKLMDLLVLHYSDGAPPRATLASRCKAEWDACVRYKAWMSAL